MSTLKIVALIVLVLAVGTCGVNEIFAAPLFVLSVILGTWEFIQECVNPKTHSYSASRTTYPEERIITEVKEVQVPVLVPAPQSKTEATEHTMEYPNGNVLTVRKVTRWH